MACTFKRKGETLPSANIVESQLAFTCPNAEHKLGNQDIYDNKYLASLCYPRTEKAACDND